MIGQTLGHYRIEAKLGEGGMGVVYKAHDLHLDRPVAIKVLPHEAMADPERKRRFVQEARAASSLNHPNILHVYDIDQAAGETGGSNDYIAMEYVSGRTLEDLIGGRRLPLDQTLNYAAQLAGGLAAAHAAGIVHRDVKPGNVMVTEKGLVKILDFGLAKLTDSVAADEGASTRTFQPLSEKGTIRGTIPYMSPEQADGKSVDARSDIFSFGSVLYEMLTGRRAFASDSKASTLSAILRQEPTPLGNLVKDVPSEITRIVTQCLRKDPARRFQHLDDVRILLEQLREDMDRGTLSGGTGAVLPARRKIIQPAIAVVALLGLLAAAVFVWWPNRTGPASEGPVFTRVTSDAGLTTDPALSPDGRLLAYASDRATAGGAQGNLDIWVQQVGSGEPLRLTRHDADDREPSFSPDGTRIVFRSERDGGGIYMVPALGGDARLIARDGRRPRFSPDGQSIVYWTGMLNQSDIVGHGRIFVVPAVGGRPKEVRPGSEDASHPVWFPDGKRLLFRRYVVGRTPTWSVTTLDGSVADSVTEGFFEGRGLTDATPMAWLPGQDRIVFTARLGDSLNVWQAPISLQTLRLTAAPERLTSGSGLESKPAVVALPGGGVRLVFAGLLENINIGSIALDTDTGHVTGELQRLTQNVASDSNPALTLDGRRLFFSSNRTGNRDIWVKDLATGKETTLTNTPVGENRPTITRDGSKLAYRLMERPAPSIQVMAVSQDSTGVPQAGVPQKVSVSGRCGHPWSWSSDGTKLLYNCPPASPVLLFDSKTAESSQIFLAGRIYQVYFSPDDHWLVFGQHYPQGRERLFVAPFVRMAPPAEKDWIAITDGKVYDAYGRWSPDGNLLYFLSDRDGFRCLWGQRLDRLRKSPSGAPFPIYHSHSSRQNLLNVPLDWQDISVAHDKIAFAMGEITGNIWMADLKGQK